MKSIISQTRSNYERYVIPSYSRYPVVIVRGKGSWVWEASGRKYLDFFPGYAVSGLGHCHPAVVRAIKNQAEKLIHLPNLYYNPLQGELARLIVSRSFPGKCFFCNSGAEANEAAIKLARKYGSSNGRYQIISMLNSFHGRTMATVTATGQKKYQDGFKPLLPGIRHIPFGDIEALSKAINGKTCAVIVEPIQGEGGINVASHEYFKGLRKLCSKHRVLLIMDEVQTGMGRTGKHFAHQLYGIQPDVMTLAKTLGGGPAIGATLAGERFADILQPGTHASTFGGNPLACAAAIAVFEIIEREKILQNVKKMGDYLRKKMVELSDSYKFVREVRGEGLMLGMELDVDGKKVVNECLEKGMLTNCTGKNVLRFMPAMTVNKQEIDLAISIVEEVFDRMRRSH